MTQAHFKVLWVETRQTLVLALPIITSQVGQLLLGLIDTLMIGRLGVTPLGASAFAVSIFSVFLVFGFGVSSCISPLVARADGAQQKRECGEILRHGMAFMLCSGILLALSIQMLSEHLVLFDQKPEVLEAAKPYLIVMGWSILPALLFNGLRQFSEGLSRAHFPMIVMLAAVILNAFLNWLWIYGNWGFAAQGLLGAAWATFVTRFAMLFALIIFVLRSTNFEENLPLKWLSRFRLKLILEMIKLGVPSALQTLFEVGAFAGAAVMMGWISTSALAAHQIAISVVSMTFMVTLGLSFATSIRVSNAMGRKDLVAARRVGFIGISLGGVLMAYFGILILIAHRWLPKFYIEDQDVVLLASKLLIVGALFQIFDGVQGVAVGALRGLHDVVFPTVVTCVAYWLICIPFVYVLGFQQDLGPVGIWVGLSVGLVVAALLLTFRFHALTQRQILALALWGQTHGAPDPKVIEEA